MKIELVKKYHKTVWFQFEDESEFTIRYDIAVKYSFKKGLDLDEQKLAEILRESQILIVREKAFELISNRLHSIKELKLKLYKKKYDSDVIDLVINELKERDYLKQTKAAAQTILKMEKRITGIWKMRGIEWKD